jgi:plastocyanin
MRNPTSTRAAAPALVRVAAPALVLVLALAACAAPGPASPGTPAAPGTATPSLPDLTPVVPTPVGGSEAPPAVVITAVNIAFQPTMASVPAGTPFALVLDNRDQGIPHGLAVADTAGNVIARGDVAAGPARVPLAMGALAAGGYTFSCQVHPNMTGTLTVIP